MRIALCCIAKCENLYLPEWLNHHIGLGFDHIYVYDNNDKDGERCEDVVGKNNKCVTVLKYFIGKRQSGCEVQVKAYNDFYKRYGKLYDWVLYLDVDEFLILNGYNNVEDYVSSLDPQAKAIELNWKCYDDNDKLHYEPFPVRSRFTRECQDKELNLYKKYFYKTKIREFSILNVHYTNYVGTAIDCEGNIIDYIKTVKSKKANHAKAYIAHYVTKSADEYYTIKKKRRGNGLGNDRLSIEHYFDFNTRTKEKEEYLNNLFDNKVVVGDFEKTNIQIVNEKPTDRISICITAYNSQDFIEECLDSVAEQTWFKTHDNWEIIVGIDGCERTLLKMKEIMHKYKNLRVLMMDSNKGTYVTSNTIIKEAKYEWILRFDSDDVMYEYMIDELMKVCSLKNIIRIPFIEFGDMPKGRKLMKRWAHGVLLYNKCAFLDVGGYNEFRCACDTDFMNRLTIMGYCEVKFEKELFKRRMHENQLTQEKTTILHGDYRDELYKILKQRITNGIIKVNTIYNTYKIIK